MKFSVDEIIDNIIKLEDLETREIRYLKKEDLDFEYRDSLFKREKSILSK